MHKPNEQAVREHIAWLYQYVRGATDGNWRDMISHAERQLDQLSKDLGLEQK